MSASANIPSIFALVVWGALAHISFGGARVALALYSLKLSQSTWVVGLVLSLIALFPAFFAIHSGRWIDRVGSRPAALLGFALCAVGCGLPWFLPVIGDIVRGLVGGVMIPALLPLFLTAACVGVGFSLVYLAIQKLVGDISLAVEPVSAAHDLTKKNFGWLAIGFSVSGFFGPFLAGLFIDNFGHAVAILALSFTALIGLLWSFKSLKAVEPKPKSDQALSSVMELVRAPELRSLYIAIVALTGAWDVHTFLVPIYGAQRGISATSIGLVLGSFAIATLVVRLVMPFFSNRLNEWRAIGFALGVSALAYAVYPFLPSLPLMFLVSFLLGLGLGFSQPMTLAILLKHAPEGRGGEAVGVRLALINVSQATLPSVFGAAGAAVGIAPVFWVMAAASAAACYASRHKK